MLTIYKICYIVCLPGHSEFVRTRKELPPHEKHSFSARFFLGTILLLTAAFAESPAQAQTTPTYHVGTNVISAPANGMDYTALYSGPVTVPFSVSDQWVDVSLAAPSAYISVGWSMTDIATLKFSGGKLPEKVVLASDVTNGAVSVLMNSAGNFHRGVYNYTSASVSGSAMLGGGYAGPFVSATTLLDANGNTQGTKSSQVTFTTDLIM